MPSSSTLAGAQLTAWQKLLPTGYRSGLGYGVARAVARPILQAYYTTRGLPVLVDYRTMPASWLDWFLYVLGFPETHKIKEWRKRRLLSIAINTWTRKGVPEVISRYLRTLTGNSSTFETLPIQAFIAEVNQAGDVCGLIGWRFEIHVPENCPLSEDELRFALKPVVPVFCTYTVHFDLPPDPAEEE